VQKPPSSNQAELNLQQEKANADKKNAKKSDEAGWFEVNEDRNTNVYVKGLPLDTTDDEFEQLMSKYGIITKDIETGRLKVRLYRDEQGELKGDGRCCYLMPESVKLCLQLLDGSEYKSHKIHAERAKFEMKGDYDPKKVVKKKNKSKEKKFLEKQRQK
jgi:HIV Tat-specific factor 1